MTLCVLVVYAEFIMEDGMEAHIFEAGNLLHIAEIVAITLAQRHDGTLGPKHFLPEVGEGTCGGGGIDLDYIGPLRSRRVLCEQSGHLHREDHDGDQEKIDSVLGPHQFSLVSSGGKGRAA